MLEDYLNELTPLRIDREGHHKPFSFRLHQNYPNPFNSSTIIRFSLEHRATVNLKIYDMLGRQVKQLVQGNLPAGEHDLHWYASNDLGSPVASGLYIILLRSDDEQQLLKTLLIR
ncbi:MAG: T9SS type A sorting domain-containing protein [Candidatus Marinimicrobia bacterium]|nr:T9SS type A sorting domain-containing protein [Candidatus Neomarinimicrobiota bacterium]